MFTTETNQSAALRHSSKVLDEFLKLLSLKTMIHNDVLPPNADMQIAVSMNVSMNFS